MAVYLPIRALNRSNNIRIDGQKIVPGVTAYIDISKGSVAKDFASHASIGQVYPVGPLTASNTDGVITTGAIVDQGASSADLILGISAGEVRSRSTGVHVAVAATTTAVTLSAADATNPRIDIVQVKVSDGSVAKKNGTPAAVPVAPTADAGYIAVANVLVDANATGIANAKITDVRPRS